MFFFYSAVIVLPFFVCILTLHLAPYILSVSPSTGVPTHGSVNGSVEGYNFGIDASQVVLRINNVVVNVSSCFSYFFFIYFSCLFFIYFSYFSFIYFSCFFFSYFYCLFFYLLFLYLRFSYFFVCLVASLY